MRLNSKRRLAVNAMIDIALRAQTGPVSLAAIARRQQVSLSRVEQLFAGLRRAGLVQSFRGPGGGFTLGREAAAISVADIVVAAEAGASSAGGKDDRSGLADDLVRQLEAVMQTHMAGIALADLVAELRDTEAGSDLHTRRSALAPRPRALPMSAHVPNSVFELAAVMARSGARLYGR